MRPRVLIPVLVLVLLLAWVSSAHGQLLRGVVVDEVTRTPIPLANITLLNDSGRVLSTRLADTAGVFEMAAPRDDSIGLKVEAVGFATLTTTRVAIGRGQLLNVEVRMRADAVAIAPMIVVARQAAPVRLQEFYRRADLAKKMGQGKIWMREDLEREGVHTVRPLLNSVIMRPSIGCRGTKILLDDLPVDARELDMISVDELEGIEVYRDAMQVPAEYAPLCSLIMMWRKPYDENARPLTWRRILIAAGLGALLFLLVLK